MKASDKMGCDLIAARLREAEANEKRAEASITIAKLQAEAQTKIAERQAEAAERQAEAQAKIAEERSKESTTMMTLFKDMLSSERNDEANVHAKKMKNSFLILLLLGCFFEHFSASPYESFLILCLCLF